MPRIYLVDNKETVGEITDAQLQFLMDHLVEEHSEDQDYYITADTIEMLRDQDNAPAEVLELLEQALGDEEGVDIAWE
ncbi:MAG: hypothetical protein KC503_04935 [Myxococcales bacterium]|nr:hypothetical protein [Myxococcales bacterium]